MDIFKIIFIAIIVTSMCLVIKQVRPEISMLVGLLGVVLIFVFSLEQIGQVIELIKELSNKAGMPATFLNIVLKIIGIAYLTEFAANVCKDVGESAISAKVQLAGKCIILVMGMTVISNFVETIVKII